MLDRPRHDSTIEAEDIPLNIVYEDAELLVVDKPAGLVVHPGAGNFHGTLVNAVAWHLKDLPSYDPNDPEVGLVHRIDKDTSGLLLVAKTPDAKRKLGVQFFNKTTRRSYNALVWGHFAEDEGCIEGNIGRDPRDRLRMKVFDPVSGIGKPAVTHYRVLERFGYVTLIECMLETGRTHRFELICGISVTRCLPMSVMEVPKSCAVTVVRRTSRSFKTALNYAIVRHFTPERWASGTRLLAERWISVHRFRVIWSS